MEVGKKHANVCSALGLALATVSTLMANTEKIKQSTQKTTKLPASGVSYTRNFNIENIEQLLTMWFDDLNQKRIPLTQRGISAKARSLFDEIQQKEGGNETFKLAKNGLQGSSNAHKFIAYKLVERLLVMTLKQLARSPPNSRKLLWTVTFHQMLFLTWMRQGCTGKSYHQELVSRGKKNWCLASRRPRADLPRSLEGTH